MTLNQLRQCFNAPWFVWVSGITYALSQTVIGAILYPISGDTLLKVQTSFFNAQDYLAFFAELRESDLLQNYANHLVVDAWHPLWYGLFGLSLLAVTMQRLDISPCKNWLLAMPIAAACLDVIENQIQLVFLTSDSQITDSLATLSTTASLLKWAAVLVFLLPALYWLSLLIIKRFTARNG